MEMPRRWKIRGSRSVFIEARRWDSYIPCRGHQGDNEDCLFDGGGSGRMRSGWRSGVFRAPDEVLGIVVLVLFASRRLLYFFSNKLSLEGIARGCVDI